MTTTQILMLGALGWIMWHLSQGASPAIAAEQQQQWNTLNGGCLPSGPIAQQINRPAWLDQMSMSNPPRIIFEGLH